MSPAAAATWLAGPTRALSRSRSAHAMPTTVCSAADCGTGPAPQPQRPRREFGPVARLPRLPLLHELASFRSRASTMNELSTRLDARGSKTAMRQDCLAHKNFCVAVSADPGDLTPAYREVRPGPLAAALLSPRPTRRTRCESRGAHGPDRFASRRLRRGATDSCCTIANMPSVSGRGCLTRIRGGMLSAMLLLLAEMAQVRGGAMSGLQSRNHPVVATAPTISVAGADFGTTSASFMVCARACLSACCERP